MAFTPPRHALPLMAAATLTLVGCIAPSAGPDAPGESGTAPKVKLFGNANGLGSLTMRVVDLRRGYGTQGVADADPWDQLVLRVHSSRLKAPRTDTLSRVGIPANNVFTSPVLSNLPPSPDYSLMVSLKATGDAIVGQGASDSIKLEAGRDATVSIYINTVGQIWFDSPTYFASSSSATTSFGFPQLMAGEPVDVLTAFNIPSPFAKFYTEFRDLGGALLNATFSVPATAAASQTVTVPGLPVGDLEGVREVSLVGLDASDRVVSRRTRKVLVQRGARLDVGLN